MGGAGGAGETGGMIGLTSASPCGAGGADASSSSGWEKMAVSEASSFASSSLSIGVHGLGGQLRGRRALRIPAPPGPPQQQIDAQQQGGNQGNQRTCRQAVGHVIKANFRSAAGQRTAIKPIVHLLDRNRLAVDGSAPALLIRHAKEDQILFFQIDGGGKPV